MSRKPEVLIIIAGGVLSGKTRVAGVIYKALIDAGVSPENVTIRDTLHMDEGSESKIRGDVPFRQEGARGLFEEMRVGLATAQTNRQARNIADLPPASGQSIKEVMGYFALRFMAPEKLEAVRARFRKIFGERPQP